MATSSHFLSLILAAVLCNATLYVGDQHTMRIIKGKKFLYATLFDSLTDVGRQRKTGIKVQRKAKKPKKKVTKKKKESYPVRKFKVKIPVEDFDYVMEYSLLFDTIFEVSRNRFDLNKNPKIEVAPNKTQDLRDEFSSYCGQKKTIKNWLFYV